MNLYKNITYKREPLGFSLSAEDEEKKVDLSVEFSAEGLCNLIRKLVNASPKLSIASEELAIKNKITGILTEVIDFQDGQPFKYVDGKAIYLEGGDDLLDEEKERLSFDAYQLRYEQFVREQNGKKQKKL